MDASIRFRRSVIARIGCAVVVAVCLGSAVYAARDQTAPPDAALVERFAAAPTDDARLALLTERPEIGEPAFRAALSQFGTDRLRRVEYAAAERAYQSLLWLGTRLAIARSRVAGLTGLASVAGQTGDLVRSQALLLQAIAIAEAESDSASLQPALNNLGIVQRRLGDYEAALRSFEQALALAEQSGRKDAIARVFNNLGLLHGNLGRADLAHDYFTRSLALRQDDGTRSSQELASSLVNIGGLYDEQGDYEQALHHYERALALLALLDANAPAGLPSILNNVGHANAALGRRVAARAHYERALPMAEAAGDRVRTATLLYNLGTLSRDEGRLDDADRYQQRSLAIREQQGDRVGLVESLTELGRLSLVRGRPADGLPHVSRAAALAADSRLLNQLWKAQFSIGQIEEALDRRDRARAAYEAGLDTIETLRQSTAGGDRGRQIYMGERLGPYYGLAGLHAEAGRMFDAFSTIERARARTLLDIVASGRAPAKPLTGAERVKERALTQAVLTASEQIAAEAALRQPDRGRLASLDGELSRARLARDAFTAALYEAQPGLQLARGEAPIVSQDRLAAMLAPDTAIVEFVVEAERVWVYLIAAGKDGPIITARRLAIGAEALTRQATRFALQVSGRDLAFATTGRALYDALLGPIDRTLVGVRHLIVVPDGALWRVPFQALQTPRGTFVIDERDVAYGPSVSALAALDRRRRSRPAREPFLVAIGDPALPDATRTGAGDRSRPAGRLPEAAREVRAIGTLYGSTRSAVMVGADATESALRERVGRASVLHIATHGVLDDRHPMYSHVLLTADTAGDTRSDGRLEAWEVTELGITADLAVLSACATARGRIGAGEGVIGLSWSLFAAGVSTAVVSQWEVDSASTTALMIAFHEALLGRPRPASTPAALRAAAREVMKNPARRHPFYWAGFIAVGAP